MSCHWHVSAHLYVYYIYSTYTLHINTPCLENQLPVAFSNNSKKSGPVPLFFDTENHHLIIHHLLTLLVQDVRLKVLHMTTRAEASILIQSSDKILQFYGSLN